MGLEPADVSQIIYQRMWFLSRHLEEREFMQRVEELNWLNRAILNHAENLKEQEKV